MKTHTNGIQHLTSLLTVEALKLKRTSTILVVFALPCLVVLFSLGMALKSQDVSQFTEQSWSKWWMGITALWCYFMLPMFVALVSGTINGNEHKNEGWRLMLALPVNLTTLYLAKFSLSVLLTAAAMVMLWIFGLLASFIISLFGAPIDKSVGMVLLNALPSMAMSVLPILVIQHAISWRFANIFVPLSVAVVATMGIVQIGSSEFWIYYPWSYMMMSALGSTDALQTQALWLSLTTGAALFWSSTFFAHTNKRAG